MNTLSSAAAYSLYFALVEFSLDIVRVSFSPKSSLLRAVIVITFIIIESWLAPYVLLADLGLDVEKAVDRRESV